MPLGHYISTRDRPCSSIFRNLNRLLNDNNFEKNMKAHVILFHENKHTAAKYGSVRIVKLFSNRKQRRLEIRSGI